MLKRLSFNSLNKHNENTKLPPIPQKSNVNTALQSQEAPQSARSESSYDDSSKALSIDSDDDISSKLNEGSEGKSKFRRGVNKFFRKQAKAFVRNFVDYGPPYANVPFDVALINECAKPVFNFFEVHKILNTRVDPNIPDPDDLYYRPIHWCARNAHLMGLRMLRRAGAKLNVTNEMGLTPLHFCVMMKHPADRRKDQVNMALYLLENGADVNIRDKGGYSPLDHAAANQDLELINMLLDFGADVVRDNKILVARRHHILKNVHDPECYKVLHERLLVEQATREKERARKAREDALLAEDRHYEKVIESLDKRKARRIAREKAKADALLKATVEEDRAQKIREEMERSLRARAEGKSSAFGVWERETSMGNSHDETHWTYKERSQAVAAQTDSKTLHAANLKIMEGLRVRNEINSFDARWRAATGGGDLELDWRRADPFRLPDIHEGKVPSGDKRDDSVGMAADALSAECDAALQGEDLDGLLADLGAL